MFIGLGWTLGENWDQVEQYLGPLSTIVVVALAVALAVLVVRRRAERIPGRHRRTG